MDPASIADFLAFESLPFDRSIYREVRKLPAGHYLTFAAGELRVVPYFESVPEGGRHPASIDEVDAEVHALLRRSIMPSRSPVQGRAACATRSSSDGACGFWPKAGSASAASPTA